MQVPDRTESVRRGCQHACLADVPNIDDETCSARHYHVRAPLPRWRPARSQLLALAALRSRARWACSVTVLLVAANGAVLASDEVSFTRKLGIPSDFTLTEAARGQPHPIPQRSAIVKARPPRLPLILHIPTRTSWSACHTPAPSGTSPLFAAQRTAIDVWPGGLRLRSARRKTDGTCEYR